MLDFHITAAAAAAAAAAAGLQSTEQNTHGTIHKRTQGKARPSDSERKLETNINHKHD